MFVCWFGVACMLHHMLSYPIPVCPILFLLVLFICQFQWKTPGFSIIVIGGCNNPKYFIVPDILMGGYILRSFAKKNYGCSS